MNETKERGTEVGHSLSVKEMEKGDETETMEACFFFLTHWMLVSIAFKY